MSGDTPFDMNRQWAISTEDVRANYNSTLGPSLKSPVFTGAYKPNFRKPYPPQRTTPTRQRQRKQGKFSSSGMEEHIFERAQRTERGDKQHRRRASEIQAAKCVRFQASVEYIKFSA